MTGPSRAEPHGLGLEPIRIGLACDGDDLAAWQAECLRTVNELELVTIGLLIRVSADAGVRSPVSNAPREQLSARYLRRVAQRKVSAARRTPFTTHLRNVPVADLRGCPASSRSFDHDVLEFIQAQDVHVILWLGSGDLPSELSSLAREGIWYFHHGDPENFRGSPPCFWELHDGDPAIRIVLLRTRSANNGSEILHCGWFRSKPTSYAKSLDRVLWGASHFVARAILDIRYNRDLECSEIVRVHSTTRADPHIFALLKMLLRCVGAWLARGYRRFFRQQQWNVGILQESITDVLQQCECGSSRPSGVDWLPERRGHFFADPFASAGSNSGQLVLVEDFVWKTGRGHIAAVEWSRRTSSAPVPIIQEDSHLSYPCLIEDGGDTYCAPESAASQGVSLYRFAAPLVWMKDKTIIAGFPAVDPTVFKHDGRWWLFCTSADTGPDEFLYAWWADELRGDWTQHALNPLKVDVRGARPAGPPFSRGDQLIRPAQDCSKSYGSAVTFQRVIKLSPTQFAEEPLGRLLPEDGVYKQGLHTICAIGDGTLIDGARLAFVPRQFWRVLLRRT